MAFDLEALLSNPAFLAGMSVLGGDPRNTGQNMLGGLTTASNLQAAAQQRRLRDAQLRQIETRAAFNPSQYMPGAPQYEPMPADMAGPPASMIGGVPQELAGRRNAFDATGFLSGGMQAGFDPSELASIAKILNPAADDKLMNLAPGGTVFDPVTRQPLYNAPFKPPEAPSALRELAGLDQLINMLPAGPQKDMFIARRDQVSGAAAQEDRKSSLAIRQAATDQAKATSEQNRMQREELARNTRVQKFAGQLETAGVPQLEKQLQGIESLISKYPKDDIPGFTRTQNTLANSGMGFTLSEEAQTNRQALQSLANVQLKDRSGAAVTNPEWERFKTELGTGSFMSSNRIRQGLAIFRNLVNSTKENFAAGVSDEDLAAYNERNPGIRLPMRGNKGGGKGGITPEEAAAELARRRGR